MSYTPFHDLADQLEVIAGQVRVLGDQVHTGSYEVPVQPPEPEPPDSGNGDGDNGNGNGDQAAMPLSKDLPAE